MKQNRLFIPLVLASGVVHFEANAIQKVKQPNFVIIITDQQQNDKLSWYGTENLSTPNMDKIAQSGYNFTNAYCSFPLSIPSRFSLFTGMYPSSVNLRFNPNKEDRNLVNMESIERMRPDMLANLFNKAGYNTYYGGKAHLVSSKTNEDPAFYGFKKIYSDDRRNLLGTDAAALLKSMESNEKPFLMVVSYINPHDICEYDDYVVLHGLKPEIRERKSDGISRIARYINDTYRWSEQEFYDSLCPPLPDNFAVMENEPKYMPGKVSNYTDKEWRMHRWVYNRLIEEVDSDIAPVIKALEEGGFMDNTYIVFLSDHGEMDGSHRREHKSVPFDEAQKVPFIISGPGIPKGIIDTTTFINTGIDLLPTLCDLAGISIPASAPGHSLENLLKGSATQLSREHLFCEGADWFQVISGEFKYTLFENGNGEAILINLKNDPGETRNVANDPEYSDIVDQLDMILRSELDNRNIKLK